MVELSKNKVIIVHCYTKTICPTRHNWPFLYLYICFIIYTTCILLIDLELLEGYKVHECCGLIGYVLYVLLCTYLYNRLWWRTGEM